MAASQNKQVADSDSAQESHAGALAPEERRTQFAWFFAAIVLISIGIGVNDAIFNNYLDDTFDLSAKVRGFLEFPRETPGLLVVVMAGMLAALPVTRLGVVGAGIFAAGMAGLALMGGSFGGMFTMMLLSSAGMHLLMPVASSIALGISKPENRGRRLGQLGALNTAGVIAGAGLIWLLLDKTHPQYRWAYGAAALAIGCGALCYAALHIPHLHRPRARIVIRRKFSLYYTLEFLFGARKQIFITFGPWVLVQVYGEPANQIAFLLMIASIIGIGFKPLVGRLIDALGERTVLMADGIALAIVCLGYGYTLNVFGSAEAALPVAGACFVLDNLLFACGTGRSVYMSRLADGPAEVTSTLATGISINHIASMVIPAIAGVVWTTLGFERVFLGAAILAVVITIVASRVPKKGALAES